MREVSDATKILEGRGTGEGKDYKPWILPREINSKGTCSLYPDWKTGRSISCLSQTERYVFVKMRWNDEVKEIREQFPLLPLSKTTEIAKRLGIRPFNNGRTIMSTDFLVFFKDGTRKAVNVKTSEKEYNDKRNLEHARIEQAYWREVYGIELTYATRDQLDMTEVLNIMDVVPQYDLANVYDDISLARHMIARKTVLVDMTRKIDYLRLIEALKETEEWKNLKSKLE